MICPLAGIHLPSCSKAFELILESYPTKAAQASAAAPSTRPKQDSHVAEVVWISVHGLLKMQRV